MDKFIDLIWMGVLSSLIVNLVIALIKKIIKGIPLRLKNIGRGTGLFLLVFLFGNLEMRVFNYFNDKDKSRYGFEDVNNIGWVASNEPGRGLALSNAGRSTAFKIKGNASMSVHVKLDGTEEGRRNFLQNGEVFVDPRFVPPHGYSGNLDFLDLSNKTLRATVIVPDTLVGRDPSKPIFLQLFVEDCGVRPVRFDAKIEEKRNITQAGQCDLKFSCDSTKNQICRIGIKMGLNPEDNNSYEGDIYIDAIDW